MVVIATFIFHVLARVSRITENLVHAKILGAGDCKTGGNQSPKPATMEAMETALAKISVQLAPLSSLVEEVRCIRSEINNFQTSVSMVHDTINKFSDTVKAMDARVAELEERCNLIPALQSKILRLDQLMHDKYQWAGSCQQYRAERNSLSKNENLYESSVRWETPLIVP